MNEAKQTFPPGTRVERDPERDTIRFLQGANLSAALENDAAFRSLQDAGDLEAVARAFLRHYGSAFRLEDPDAELALLSSSRDDLGMTHVKLQQQLGDLPVLDQQLIVHLDAAGHVTLVNGAYVPTPKGLTAKPALGAAEARRAAAEAAGLPDCEACPADRVVFAADGAAPRLAWRVETRGGLTQRFEVVVDAETSDVLRKVPRVIRTLAPAFDAGRAKD